MTEETNNPDAETAAPERDDRPHLSIGTLIAERIDQKYTPYSGELRGDAIDRIKALAAEGTEPKLVMIPTAGFGPDLPSQVPVLWDRAAQEPIPVIDIIEDARQAPRRRGTAKATTLASFVDLVNRHKDSDSAIFAATSWPGPKLTAVIDYHTRDGEARRAAHRIVYDFPITKEFNAWIQGDGKPLSQVAFAAFLEDHAAELAAPYDAEKSEIEPRFKERFATPAELLDLSRELEVHEGSKVKQGVRLQTGERVVEFTTEHTNSKGEKVNIPGIFIVSIKPFLEGDRPVEPVRLVARLRYRISEGALLWFYSLYRWEEVLRERIQLDLLRTAKETGLPCFEGTPEMAAA
jgi:uncharacterized protein YfdQ (DUF2303 family)